MSPNHASDPPQWQGNLLADCMDAQSAAGISGSLGQLYDPDGSWPGIQEHRMAQERQARENSNSLPADSIGETQPVDRETGLEFVSSGTVNVFTAPRLTAVSDNLGLQSMAQPGELYGQLTEADMHTIIHEAQDRAQVIALQVARNIGWAMPSLISPPDQLFQTEVVQFPLAPVARMTG